jgi:hypothetical protein
VVSASARETNAPRSISLSTWRTQASALTLVVKVWGWMGYPRRRTRARPLKVATFLDGRHCYLLTDYR